MRCTQRRRPAGGVKTRRIPAGKFFPGVIGFSEAKVVKSDRRGGSNKALGGVDKSLSTILVHDAQRESHLRRAAPGGFFKIPHTGVERVHKAVAQANADDVFALRQTRGGVIAVIIQDIGGIADIGGKRPLSDVLAVDRQGVKAKAADQQPGLA